MKTYFAFLFLLAPIGLYSQRELEFDFVEEYTELKNGSCGTNSSGDYAYYYDPNTWIPRMDQEPIHNSPIKHIQININVFQRSDGTGNFQNTQQDRQVLINMVNAWNNMYSSITPTSDPFNWVVELPNRDSRIRFDIGPLGNERIYFYQNDNLYGEYSGNRIRNYIEDVAPERLQYFNILLTEGYYLAHIHPDIIITNGGSGYTSPPIVKFDSDTYCEHAKAKAQVYNGKLSSINLDILGYKDGKPIYDEGIYNGTKNSVSIILIGGGGTEATASCHLYGGANGGAFRPFFSQLSIDMYFLAFQFKTEGINEKVCAHEIGHSLDLDHTFDDGTGCKYCNINNYLPDVYGLTFPGKCPLERSSTNAFISSNDNITNNLMNYHDKIEYLSPMQVGIMHRSVALSSMRKYVKECHSDVPLVISNKSETWDFNMRLYRDIIIENSGVLELACYLIMPEVGKIIVNNNGKLILNGSIVTNTSNEWNGIEVNDGGVLEIESGIISKYKIKVNTGGTLIFKESSACTLTEYGMIDINSGGYICGEMDVNITLQNQLNVINLHYGYIEGVNTSVVTYPVNCVSDWRLNYSGNGSINNQYSNNAYIQNETISTDRYITGRNIFVGKNVTTSKPQGNVYIINGAKVIFDARYNVFFEDGLEVDQNSKFDVK